MDLTTQQKEIITKLETQLSEQLWGNVYYGETPNQEVLSLFKDGVELNFEVTLIPYVGRNHPDSVEYWGEM